MANPNRALAENPILEIERDGDPRAAVVTAPVASPRPQNPIRSQRCLQHQVRRSLPPLIPAAPCHHRPEPPVALEKALPAAR